MLQAMNTGHAGSMTTVHANTPRELLGRLETMVHDGRASSCRSGPSGSRSSWRSASSCSCSGPPAGPRVVHSITEIQGMEGDTVLLQDIFHRVDTVRRDGPPGPDRPAAQDPRRAGAQRDRGAAAHLPQRRRCTARLGRSGGGRHHRPARPGRAVEPPSEELYEMLARRRETGGERRDARGTAAEHARRRRFVAAVLVGGGLSLAVVAVPSCGCARSSARWPRSSTTPWARPRCPSRS